MVRNNYICFFIGQLLWPEHWAPLIRKIWRYEWFHLKVIIVSMFHNLTSHNQEPYNCLIIIIRWNMIRMKNLQLYFIFCTQSALLKLWITSVNYVWSDYYFWFLRPLWHMKLDRFSSKNEQNSGFFACDWLIVIFSWILLVEKDMKRITDLLQELWQQAILTKLQVVLRFFQCSMLSQPLIQISLGVFKKKLLIVTKFFVINYL